MSLLVLRDLNPAGCRTRGGAYPLRQGAWIFEVVDSDFEPVTALPTADLFGDGHHPSLPAKEPVSEYVAFAIGADDDLGRRWCRQLRPALRLGDHPVSTAIAELATFDADAGKRAVAGLTHRRRNGTVRHPG